jgi:hypothetical protein
MTSATNDRVFDLIQLAILQLSEHTIKADCDDIHLAEAFAALDKARTLVRPVSLIQKPGYVECPGVYRGDHVRLSATVGKCRHCHSEQRIVMYGKYLREHYVPFLEPEPSKLRGSLTTNYPECSEHPDQSQSDCDACIAAADANKPTEAR